jgi:hypothetical protein
LASETSDGFDVRCTRKAAFNCLARTRLLMSKSSIETLGEFVVEAAAFENANDS